MSGGPVRCVLWPRGGGSVHHATWCAARHSEGDLVLPSGHLNTSVIWWLNLSVMQLRSCHASTLSHAV